MRLAWPSRPIFRSTGVKMFLILTLALLPLGLVALFASLQAIRTADLERDSLLRMTAMQSARKLSTAMASDQAALRLVVDTLASGGERERMCAQTDALLSARAEEQVRFALYTRAGNRICGSTGARQVHIARDLQDSRQDVTLKPDQGWLLARIPSTDGQIIAFAVYDRNYLFRITELSAALQNRHLHLSQGTVRLNVADAKTSRNSHSVSALIEPTDISLTIIVRDPPVTLARMLSMFLPLLMWLAAAAIGWFVVNRLLIKPLVQLRRVVAAYQPGEVLEPLKRMRTPAREIEDLGNTFRAISEDVATHEAEMAEGLERQTKLTREVHHRVKNNLQIIASLISLHARSAATAEAADAYASIQRRVDALSVVHRNHYAELEENRGIGLRSLVSELSASLRGTAPAGAHRSTIQVDCDNLHVGQDVAVPVAFLITELVELAMLIDPAQPIRIAVRGAQDDGRAMLHICSPALRPSATMQTYLDKRFGRVLTGLSRQLRAPLDYDEGEGEYCIAIALQATAIRLSGNQP